MKVSKLTTASQLVGLLRECYPHLPGIVVPKLHPRSQAKIDMVLNEYRRTEMPLTRTATVTGYGGYGDSALNSRLILCGAAEG
jgi:hypothetical protein